MRVMQTGEEEVKVFLFWDGVCIQKSSYGIHQEMSTVDITHSEK
jgi:sulfur relay (sulfurtransferase) complex TusBCD TusD component (DsrE family)